MAWKISTIRPSTLVAAGPKRMALRPVPVMWEQLPVTEGIFSEEITNTKAPQRASSRRFWFCSPTFRRICPTPTTRKGRQTTPHTAHMAGGR